jgi:EmrB/QacA subfamily drug resistance transporter
VLLSTFLVQLDTTIVNVALTDIKQSLHPSIPGLQWVVDAYLLVLASMLITSGALGDRVGRRKVFQTGLIVFALASFLCCLAPNMGFLIGFRALQAVGASMLNPSGMSLISDMFRNPAAKARAFAVWGAVVGIGMAAGPLIGGPLVNLFGWRSVFWINIPLALGVAAIVPAYVPESRSNERRRLDIPGQALILVALASTIYTIIEFPRSGFSPSTLSTASVATFALGMFLYAERRHAQPLIELQYFKSKPFSFAMLIAVANYASIGGFLFLNTLRLQNSLGFSPLKAGLLTVPMALATAVSARYSGQLIEKYGYLCPIVLAGSALVLGSIASVVVSYHFNTVLLLVSFLLFGIGFGGANTPVNTIAMLGIPCSRSAVAGAIASTSRHVGQSVGVAVVGSCFVFALADNPITSHFGVSSIAAWAVLAAMGILVVIFGYRATRPRAQIAS